MVASADEVQAAPVSP